MKQSEIMKIKKGDKVKVSDHESATWFTVVKTRGLHLEIKESDLYHTQIIDASLVTQIQSNWGGKRKGAGRPKVQNPKKTLTISLTQSEIATLAILEAKSGLSRSATIAMLINKVYSDIANPYV